MEFDSKAANFENVLDLLKNHLQVGVLPCLRRFNPSFGLATSEAF